MQYYDWDEWKSRFNESKHGVRFEDAVRVFDDPQVLIEFDRVVDGEERWHAIGSPNGVAIILVAHIRSRRLGSVHPAYLSATGFAFGEETI